MTGEDKDFDDFWMDCLGASALRLQFIDTTPSRNDKNCEEGTKIVISGFLAEHRDVWYFVTAGHCLLDIVEAQKRGQRLQQFHLSDRHNPKRDGPQQLIPFDFGDAEKFGNVDFDIGAIQLNDASRRILEAKRPRPLKLSDCRPISETDSVDTYLLLGTPSQYVHDLGFSVAAVHVEPIPRRQISRVMRIGFMERFM